MLVRCWLRGWLLLGLHCVRDDGGFWVKKARVDVRIVATLVAGVWKWVSWKRGQRKLVKICGFAVCNSNCQS